MATHKTCDICMGALKDLEPVYLTLRSDNEAFHQDGNPNEDVSSLRNLFAERTYKLDQHLELCVICGMKLVMALSEAIYKGHAEFKEFTKLKLR